MTPDSTLNHVFVLFAFWFVIRARLCWQVVPALLWPFVTSSSTSQSFHPSLHLNATSIVLCLSSFRVLLTESNTDRNLLVCREYSSFITRRPTVSTRKIQNQISHLKSLEQTQAAYSTCLHDLINPWIASSIARRRQSAMFDETNPRPRQSVVLRKL